MLHSTWMMTINHEDDNKSIIIYIILFTRISNQLFNFVSCSSQKYAKATGEVAIAPCILKHREAKRFAAGNSAAKPLA